MFKAKFILVVIIILCSYGYFSNPDGIAITKEGKVDGLINNGRAILQSDKFWKLQLERVNEKYNKNLTPGESMTSKMQENDQNLREYYKEVDDNSKGQYTPEEVMANSLRRKADSIEKAGNYRERDEWSEKSRLETIEDCKIIIPLIETKLINEKASYTLIFLLSCVLLFALLIIFTKYKRAIVAKRRNLEQLYTRGNVNYRYKDYKEAIADYTEIIEIKPKYKSAFIERGHAKLKQQDFKGAIEDYTKAIKIKPKSEDAYIQRGVAKILLQDYNGAIVDQTIAIKINPKNAFAFIKRGHAKIACQDYRGAIKDYTKAIEIKPEDANAYIERGHAKIEIQDFTDAIADYTKAIVIKPEDADIQSHKLDYDGAIADYTKAIEIYPYDTPAYFIRGENKISIRDFKGAIADFTKVIEINPEHANAYYSRGLSKIELGQNDRACMDFRKAGELGIDNAFETMQQYC